MSALAPRFVFLVALPFGVSGWDWIWLGLAVFFDLSHYAQAYAQRGQMPGIRSA